MKQTAKKTIRRPLRTPYKRRAAALSRTCAAPGCGRAFRTFSRTARYCCTTCRVAAHRAGQGVEHGH
jgi:uncharacterized protein (DUF983 family)